MKFREIMAIKFKVEILIIYLHVTIKILYLSKPYNYMALKTWTLAWTSAFKHDPMQVA